MHDVFWLDELTNDAQHLALAHWLDIARHDPAVPVNRMMACQLTPTAKAACILLDLTAGSIREARVQWTGVAVPQSLGIDPVGMTLGGLLPDSYVADVIPAYAFCAGSFRPLSSLDEVTYSDGTQILVRRLVLPLGRQPEGGAFTASHLMVIYDPASAKQVGKAQDGSCRSMQSTRSLSVALFKDRLDG